MHSAQMAGLQTYSWWALKSWSVEIVEWPPVKSMLGPLLCQRSTLGVVGTQCSAAYFMRLVLTRLTTILYIIVYTASLASKRKSTATYAKIILQETKITLACNLVNLGIDMIFWNN